MAAFVLGLKFEVCSPSIRALRSHSALPVPAQPPGLSPSCPWTRTPWQSPRTPHTLPTDQDPILAFQADHQPLSQRCHSRGLPQLPTALPYPAMEPAKLDLPMDPHPGLASPHPVPIPIPGECPGLVLPHTYGLLDQVSLSITFRRADLALLKSGVSCTKPCKQRKQYAGSFYKSRGSVFCFFFFFLLSQTANWDYLYFTYNIITPVMSCLRQPHQSTAEHVWCQLK